jgi:hypothetical protein
MMATTHILAGAALARVLRRPKWAWPAAAFSYFVLDALPHVNLEQYFQHPAKGFVALGDAAVGLTIAWLLIRRQPDRTVMAGAVVAVVLVGILTNAAHMLLWFSYLPGHPLLFGAGHLVGVATQLLLLGASVMVLSRRPATADTEPTGR